ncbi:MAG: heme ABC transporter permease [Alphaproteobacteria bacterium]|nr:heme ABC transporter permease [Alphaproteobacteria bacterium]
MTSIWNKIEQYGNPTRFMEWSWPVMLAFASMALVLLSAGLFQAFFVAPEDYQQGHTVKIMFVHVPAAWLAMMGYGVVAFSSFGLLVFRHPLADVAAKSAVPIGAAFTFLALVTGSLWGKPMWGTYWVWDARLTSVLVLFFMYLGLMALRSSIEDEHLAARLTAILSIIGIGILPFIKISVEGLSIPWLGVELPSWNTLHQPSSVMRMDGPTIHPTILWPLLICAAGFTCAFFAMHLKAMRNEILRRRLKALMQAQVQQARRDERMALATGDAGSRRASR